MQCLTIRRLSATLVVMFGGLSLGESRLPAAEIRVRSREEWIAALGRARPGDSILLAPGTYRGGIAQSGLNGAKGRPIVIASQDPQMPAVIEGGRSGLHLSRPEFVELRDLVFTGAEANGINIDDGGGSDPAHDVALVRLVVKNEAPAGNRDGIKLSGLDTFRIEDCTIERWGMSGSAIDMVGCHEGTVSGCTFRHSGADYANGVQAKGGSRAIVIRRCRFENAGGRAVNLGGNTGLPYFRPKPQGYEAKDITLEDSTIIGSMSPVAFVGVDGATVRHNTFYRPTRWVVRILQENQGKEFVPSRNGTFSNNIVAFRSDEVRTVVNVGGGTAPETFTFLENAWICLDRPQATRDLLRLPVRETGGTYGVDPGFRAPDKGDLSLATPTRLKAGVRAER